MAGVEKGDKVKVSFEGTVEATPNDEWVGVRLDDGLIHWVHADERVTTVEKAQPEVEVVEVFGPGALLRSKREGSIWAVGKGGYLRMDGAHAPQRSGSQFTSELYERVEV